jgi:hypothetical protein
MKFRNASAALLLALGVLSQAARLPSAPSQLPATSSASQSSAPPTPLVQEGKAVDWWLVFKFNAASFPGCGSAQRQCTFGGQIQPYRAFSQQFVFASSVNHTFQQGGDCIGDTTTDPVGATFGQIYNNAFSYVIWNDQFYDDPVIQGCTKECGAPWGHSKGMLAWNDAGDGLVMQVSTPSWPAAGSKTVPRKTDGNTLGCVKDNDVQVSQHFFSLKITKDDLVKILKALANASVVTDPTNTQIVKNGGPADVQALVNNLGRKSTSKTVTTDTLSSGVQLIAKSSGEHVPTWQMVSAVLGGVSLRAATWWTNPAVPTTTTSSPEPACWDSALGKPGPVEIATTGLWAGKTFGLTGGLGANFNHAKIGISTSGTHHYAIFGDMNQQGSLSGPCGSSQNGRGGLFYVIDDSALAESVKALIAGGTAAPK